MTNKICIFGASGATGLALAEQARERNLEVMAFVRSETARDRLPPGVTAVVGNILDRTDVERAIIGVEAVICVIGPHPSSPEVFCADAMQNIMDSMKAQGVCRLLCVTGAMIGDYPHLSWFMRSMKDSYQKQQPNLAQDRADQEKCIEASNLDWTIVKPPRLTNGKGSGHIRSGEALKVGAMSSLSRVDLSRFLLDQVHSQEYVGKRVVVKS
jgi:putative NADH-flavin reductase